MLWQAHDAVVPVLRLQLKRRPSTTYMEVVQNDINVSMRTILIDWLVEVVQVSHTSSLMFGNTCGLCHDRTAFSFSV